ncbi:MAG TPA: flagellar export protein FliJ [Tepidisphaeraceae bacterium]|nr:flagellar export protein FliJ [Tepidisphaeraceae bacterium]
MARFEFKLEGVLRHRERIEQDRQRDLALVQADMGQLQAELRAFNVDVQRNVSAARNQLVGKLDMGYLAAHRRYMLGMQRKVHDLAQRMAAQQQKVDEARSALTDATKQKKILEKLRERQQQRWAAEHNRREAGALDELTTQLSYQALARQAEDPQ